jgi:hypothetical protein
MSIIEPNKCQKEPPKCSQVSNAASKLDSALGDLDKKIDELFARLLAVRMPKAQCVEPAIGREKPNYAPLAVYIHMCSGKIVEMMKKIDLLLDEIEL